MKKIKKQTISLMAISTYFIILMYAITPLFELLLPKTEVTFSLGMFFFIRFVFNRTELVKNDTSLAYVGQF